MKPSKREQELFKGLTPYTGHADELAKPLPEELSGSVTHYDEPFEPLPDWEEADAMASSHVSLLRANRQSVKALAAEHGCHNVRVFGSVARGEDTPDSDIDLLVDAQSGTTLLDMGGLQIALEDQLGVPIDLRTPGDIHQNFRADVVARAKPIDEV